MKFLFILLITGIWIGLLLGLSFIEAPLKFKAPNITTELGLGIGRIMFNTLNKIEIVFSIILSLLYWKMAKEMTFVAVVLLAVLVVIVLLQSLVLLPALNLRVSSILSGELVSRSYHHIAYILCEVLKTIILVATFFVVFKQLQY